ncbi:MAG: hypothetical protein JNK85_23995 [Verrucomicrobiales bacterium]|nr:hypothetical protein [Verrucomicrobiales bacterium]
MNLTPEQQTELAQFPPTLRALVEAELSAGNSIVEIGHGHPAPPVGAYFKLANRVTTCPRASGAGLNFYERNGSSHSGEFTDEKRFFFVLEPPNPPPPEPDMDAIRKALEPKPDPLVQLAQRPAGSGGRTRIGAPAAAAKSASAKKGSVRKRSRASAPASESPVADKAVIAFESPTGRTHLLHFIDPRPPQQVQFALERELMTLLTPAMDKDRLKWNAVAKVNGADYRFELRFLAALPTGNQYSLQTEVSWQDQSATNHEYFRKTSASWIQMWTRDLKPANPPTEESQLSEPYRALCQDALQAEATLDSVAAVQQAVIDGLKRGGRFATSHKEGGTQIYWRIDRFVRSDHGDHPDHKEYANEEVFLGMLRQFCHSEVVRHVGKTPLSEFDAWKLILRRMQCE